MIVADIGAYQALKGYVVQKIQDELRNKILEYKTTLKDILDLYPEEDIDRAITNGIRRAGNKIFMQTAGEEGRILRSLEFGTGTVKALHLVTLATRAVIGGRV